MKISERWSELLSTPVARSLKEILGKGDRRPYALWLCQVAHLTRHTSAHQALVGTRVGEVSIRYAKYCFEHAMEEAGHEQMALADLRRIGLPARGIEDLPAPLPSTELLTAYLYHAATRSHPATRLGFSYWAEKCYPYIEMLARDTQSSLGLADSQMTFFVSHAAIDEKHARSVEQIIEEVCRTQEDWDAVERGMLESLNLAIRIFEEILRDTGSARWLASERSA
jgi:hypothetical protein